LAYQKPQLNIVGNHSLANKLPIFEGNSEIWVFNGKGATLPRYDAVFQMHLECDWGGQWSRNWLRNNQAIPVFMREVHADIPASIQYPFDKVFEMLARVKHNGKPLKYFTSTIAWAIALAVLQKRPKVLVYAIDMQDGEYVEQKDCFAFWIGFAAGRGTELEINCADNIFSKPLYGSYPLQ
jgi:hypothetical protein